jgi:hypothetical protein
MDNTQKYLIQLDNQTICKNEVGPILKNTSFGMDFHMENDVRLVLKYTCSDLMIAWFGEKMADN